MSAKIFVRERRKVEKGEKKPRFRVVGVSGGDLKLKVFHIRKKELDQIKDATGAEIVMLDAGHGKKNGGGQAA
jgi:N-acetylmuramoyl-L-alanine amidase